MGVASTRVDDDRFDGGTGFSVVSRDALPNGYPSVQYNGKLSTTLWTYTPQPFDVEPLGREEARTSTPFYCDTTGNVHATASGMHQNGL